MRQRVSLLAGKDKPTPFGAGQRRLAIRFVHRVAAPLSHEFR